MKSKKEQREGFLDRELIEKLESFEDMNFYKLEGMEINEIAHILHRSKDVAKHVKTFMNFLPKIEVTIFIENIY